MYFWYSCGFGFKADLLGDFILKGTYLAVLKEATETVYSFPLLCVGQ